MEYNVITNAEKTYENAMSKPSLGGAVVMVILAGLALGLAAYLMFNGNIMGLVGGVVVNLVQWIVLSAVLWLLYIMFKEKKMGELEFAQIGSATGKLWVLVLAMNIILTIGVVAYSAGALTGILGLLMFLILIVLGVLILYSHYKLVKTMLSSNRGRQILVWAFSLILTSLVSGLIISLINSIL